MNTVNLTPEETALLTPFNCVAFDSMRVESKKRGSVSPCWLCCSDEARHKARQDVLWLLRGATGQYTMLSDEAEKLVASQLSATIVRAWKDAELFYKRARAEGNPRAFFAE